MRLVTLLLRNLARYKKSSLSENSSNDFPRNIKNLCSCVHLILDNQTSVKHHGEMNINDNRIPPGRVTANRYWTPQRWSVNSTILRSFANSQFHLGDHVNIHVNHLYLYINCFHLQSIELVLIWRTAFKAMKPKTCARQGIIRVFFTTLPCYPLFFYSIFTIISSHVGKSMRISSRDIVAMAAETF